MAEVILMPKLSDTMVEGVVAEWHKKVGDQVKTGELLAEIETDKATMEFESFYDGELLHIGVEKGKSVPVNVILAIIGKKGEDISDLLKSAPAADASKVEGKAEEKAEEKSEENSEQKSEDKSEDKAEEKSEDKAEGKAEEKPEVKVDAKAELASEASVTAAPKKQVAASVPVNNSNSRVYASPLAKKMAEEKGIDLNTVGGTGENGRITRRDIEHYIPYTPANAPTRAYASVAGVESHTDESVSQMRKTIARRLAESKFTAPHFYLTQDIDMDNAIAARKAMNVDDVKISFNDLVVKAVAMALTKHPVINSSWQGDVIRANGHIHIGVAVAVPDGLLVPVVRFADSKGLQQIGDEVRELAQKAKDKKLQPAEWEGNTFTISNLGMFGIESFTAIINTPDSCILAIGGIKEIPVVKNGAVVPGNVMKVTLSCDHRVVDGASGAAFLNTFKAFLENPVMMLV